MDFRILGPLEIWEGTSEVHLAGGKERALLAMLLVEPNRVVGSERLVSLLWGSEPPETAMNTLQVYVSRVRRALEPGREPRSSGGILVTRPPGYELRVPADTVDARRFDTRAQTGGALVATDPAQASEILRSALAEWRGPALAEFATMPFALAEGQRLEEHRVVALEQRIEAELALGAHQSLIGELEALVREHPLRERLRGHLMLALYRAGRQADALRICAEARTLLVEQLGIDPSPALRALERAILTQDASLTWHPLGDIHSPSSATASARVSLGATLDINTAAGRELVPLAREETKIGRDLLNDLVLDGDGQMSRYHAVVARDAQGWTIRDLASSNGTFLNGDRVTDTSVLRDGDELRLGGTSMRFRLTQAGAATLKAQ